MRRGFERGFDCYQIRSFIGGRVTKFPAHLPVVQQNFHLSAGTGVQHTERTIQVVERQGVGDQGRELYRAAPRQIDRCGIVFGLRGAVKLASSRASLGAEVVG